MRLTPLCVNMPIGSPTDHSASARPGGMVGTARMHATDIAALLLASDAKPPSQAAPPSAHGFYAWWCRDECLDRADPPIPREPRPPVSPTWSLLYVGISPNGPTSARNVAIRFAKDHTGGTIGGSTFRQSIASLLLASLALEPRQGSDRSRLVSEAPLANWIEASCGVTFASVERPWLLEKDVIGLLNPPLNIDNGTHPFRWKVKAQRAALRRACGL